MQTKALSARRGADVVCDSVGRTLRDSLAAARIGGTVVFYGMVAGDPDPVDPRLLMDRSLTLTGGDLWNVLISAAVRRERAAAWFAQIRAVRCGQTSPHASRAVMAPGQMRISRAARRSARCC